MANIERRAIDALRADAKLMATIESSEGAAWGSINRLQQLSRPPSSFRPLLMTSLPKHTGF
ncbi:MAG: hypothetical protein M0Z29_05125 [Actinomycetota bacterium]|nr:hypothetical protein [Actinomycetota bacterium]